MACIMRNNNIYIEVGRRLKKYIDELGVGVEELSAVTGMSEKRINEIIEVKGRKVKIEEIVILQERAFISPDYLVGITDYPFPLEPTKEDKKKLIEMIKKRMNAL